MRVLKKRDLFRIFARSFYIQASWNYQRMLNLGFCYALLPILNKLYRTHEEKVRFLKRHLEFFNAHPYFASFALGATARLEEQYRQENWDSEKPIIVFKNRLCGPLGAIGDRLFWGTVKPLAAMVGVFITLFYGIVGPVALFVLYNVPHIYLRYFGVIKGYDLGFDIVRELSKRRFERYTLNLKVVGLTVLGFFVGMYSGWMGKNEGFGILLILAGAMAISYGFIRWRKPIFMPILINIILFLGYAWLIGF